MVRRNQEFREKKRAGNGEGQTDFSATVLFVLLVVCLSNTNKLAARMVKTPASLPALVCVAVKGELAHKESLL